MVPLNRGGRKTITNRAALILATGLLLTAFVIALALILGPRHAIVTRGEGYAVRLDRWTGQAFVISGREEWPVATHKPPKPPPSPSDTIPTVGNLLNDPAFVDLPMEAKLVEIERVARRDKEFRSLSPEAQAIVRRRLLSLGQSLLASFRRRFPEYSDLTDLQLAKRLAETYPNFTVADMLMGKPPRKEEVFVRVVVPNVGEVHFPNSMSHNEMTQASRWLYERSLSRTPTPTTKRLP